METFEAERNAGHNGLFLLDDHAGVGADRSQVEVVLNAKRETEHERQQQQEPRSETPYLGRKFHVELRRPYVHLTLVGLRFFSETSAYLRDLCVNGNFNAEVAEIRRGQQRKAVDLEEPMLSVFIFIKGPHPGFEFAPNSERKRNVST